MRSELPKSDTPAGLVQIQICENRSPQRAFSSSSTVPVITFTLRSRATWRVRSVRSPDLDPPARKDALKQSGFTAAIVADNDIYSRKIFQLWHRCRLQKSEVRPI